jgi:hypothetical protein
MSKKLIDKLSWLLVQQLGWKFYPAWEQRFGSVIYA